MDENTFKKRRTTAIFIIDQLVKDEIFYDDFMNTLRLELLKHRPEDVEVNKFSE